MHGMSSDFQQKPHNIYPGVLRYTIINTFEILFFFLMAFTYTSYYNYITLNLKTKNIIILTFDIIISNESHSERSSVNLDTVREYWRQPFSSRPPPDIRNNTTNGIGCEGGCQSLVK